MTSHGGVRINTNPPIRPLCTMGLSLGLRLAQKYEPAAPA
jgi:hypothetical protein